MDSLTLFTNAVGKAIKGQILGNIILQPILNYSLSMLWGLVNGI